MKTYKFRVFVLSSILSILLITTPYLRFNLDDFFILWPYFDWELGFGSIPYRPHWQVIYIDQVDDKIFDPPVPLNEYLTKHTDVEVYWVPTQHYKMQTMLAQANHRGDLDDVKRIKDLIYKYWFYPVSKRIVKYHLAIIEIDPIQYKKDQSILAKKVVLRDVFNR